MFGKCTQCGLPRTKTPFQTKSTVDGLHVPGARGSAKRAERLQKLTVKAFELREQGWPVKDIAFKLKVGLAVVHACLNDQQHVKQRIEAYNEQLRAYSPKALDIVRELLYSTDPRDKKQQREVAVWLLEATKVVGKESPVNIFVNAPGAQSVVLNHAEINAAKAVADLMRQKQLPPAPKPAIIDAEVVATTEEKPVGGATSSPNPPSL